jgi:hypothetical protein
MLSAGLEPSITVVKKEEVIGDRRTLHDDELCDLFSSPNVIQVIRLK